MTNNEQSVMLVGYQAQGRPNELCHRHFTLAPASRFLGLDLGHDTGEKVKESHDREMK
jgi:hypothetical protein